MTECCRSPVPLERNVSGWLFNERSDTPGLAIHMTSMLDPARLIRFLGQGCSRPLNPPEPLNQGWMRVVKGTEEWVHLQGSRHTTSRHKHVVDSSSHRSRLPPQADHCPLLWYIIIYTQVWGAPPVSTLDIISGRQHTKFSIHRYVWILLRCCESWCLLQKVSERVAY
jgi:hypothetical protein